MSFLEYLQRTKEAIKTIKPGVSIEVVMGNESCDMDSVVSSLSLAYYYSTLEKFQKQLVIPVITKTEKLFPIKVENIYLLTKYGIDYSTLVYKDNINLKRLLNHCNVSVTLVDHHVLPMEYEFLRKYVSTIIDHRPIDESQVWNENIFRDIQQVGSCCTLIAKHISINEETPVEILNMFYDVITYDTIAYDEAAGKVRPLDLQTAETLEKLLSLEGDQAQQRLERFDEIFKAHKNISQLTSEQLLYKDLKLVSDIYVPGLPMLVEAYLQRFDMESALQKFASDNHTDTILLMGIDVLNGEVMRDLGMYAKNERIANKIEDILLNKFECGKIHYIGNCKFIQYFQQTNVKLSRKQLVPLLQSVFKSI